MTQAQNRSTQPDQDARLRRRANGEGSRFDRWTGEPSMEHSGWPSSSLGLVRRMMDRIDRIFGFAAPFGWLGRPFWPEVELLERNGQLVVRADLPGIRSEDVRVRMDEGILRIEGRRRHETESREGGMFRSERGYGFFQRNIELPGGVDPDTVHARFEGGVLEVTMPAPDKGGKGRIIPIHTSHDPAMRS